MVLRFYSNSSLLCLAILHPKKISVYVVTNNIGAEHGNYYTLDKKYSHMLEHTSYNFTWGPFGGVYGEATKLHFF